MKNANRIQKDWLDAIEQRLLAKGELKHVGKYYEHKRNTRWGVRSIQSNQSRITRLFKKSQAYISKAYGYVSLQAGGIFLSKNSILF